MAKQLLDTIFKYFNWNDLDTRKLLTEKELYFCNADKWKNFGEYSFSFKPIQKQLLYERMERVIYQMRNETGKLYERWFNIHIRKYRIYTGNYNSLTPVEKELWEQQMVDQIMDHRIGEITSNLSDYEKSTKNFYFKRTGIFSTSLSSSSKQLWGWKSVYGGISNEDAVCVGLDLNKLKSSLDKIGNYSMGVVRYGEDINEVDFVGTTDTFFVDRLNSITFTLEKNAVADIEEQQELRILKFLRDNKSKRSPERFLKFDSDVITEILVKSSATSAAKEEIEKIAKLHGHKLTYI